VKQPLHTSLLHHSHHSNRSSATHRPHNRPSPGSNPLPPSHCFTWNIRYLCLQACAPTNAQPRINRAPTTTDTKRGSTPRQHPAQSVTNAHTWAPLTHSPAPQLHEGARAPDSDAPHKRTQRALRPARPPSPLGLGWCCWHFV